MRRRFLITAVVVSLGAWTDLSIHSPVNGWARSVIHRGRTAIYRFSAEAPSSACAFASTTIDGVSIRYPVIFQEVVLPPSSEPSLRGAMFAWKRCGLTFLVSPVDSPARYLELERRSNVITEERNMNGWVILVERSRPSSHARAEIVGQHRAVTVAASLDERLEDTDLSRWLDQAFQEAVDSVCQNRAEMAASTAIDASPARSAVSPSHSAVTALPQGGRRRASRPPAERDRSVH